MEEGKDDWGATGGKKKSSSICFSNRKLLLVGAGTFMSVIKILLYHKAPRKYSKIPNLELLWATHIHNSIKPGTCVIFK